MGIQEIITLGELLLKKYQHTIRISKDSKTIYFNIKCNCGGIPEIPVTVGTETGKVEKYLRKAIGKSVDKANHYSKGVKLAC